MWFFLPFLWLCNVCCHVCCGQSAAYPLPTPIWPKPQQFSHGNISCTVKRSTLKWIKQNAAIHSKQLLDIAIQNITDIIFAWDNEIQINIMNNNNHYKKSMDINNNTLQQIIIDYSSRNEILDSNMIENYTISMNYNCSIIRLSSIEIWGIMRGLQTISQLIHYSRQDGIYYLNRAPWFINDYPRFKHRGVMIDAGLHFISKSAIKRTIAGAAYNKLNVFHFHATESCNMPLESMEYPDLAKKGSFPFPNSIYTQDDLREIVEFGKQLGIRIILELDMPGHSYAWGIGYPQLIADCPQMYPIEVNYWHSAFNPTINYTYQFMNNFINEMFDIFIDDYIHFGGDEVVDFSWLCWNSTASIRKYMEENNMTLLDLYAMFEERIFQISNKANKKSIVWDDVFINVPSSLDPSHNVIQIWRENATIVENILKSGFYAIQSAENEYYLNLGFDYGDRYRKAWDIYRTDPLPLYYNLTESERRLFLGAEVCIWGEDVDEYNLDQRLWFRASVFAERVWTESKWLNIYNLNDTTRRIIQHRCSLLQRGLHPSAYQDDDDYPFPMRSEFEQCQLNIPPYVPLY